MAPGLSARRPWAGTTTGPAGSIIIIPFIARVMWTLASSAQAQVTDSSRSGRPPVFSITI